MGAIIDVFLDLTAINSPITGGDLLLELENFTSLNKSEYFTVKVLHFGSQQFLENSPKLTKK